MSLHTLEVQFACPCGRVLPAPGRCTCGELVTVPICGALTAGEVQAPQPTVVLPSGPRRAFPHGWAEVVAGTEPELDVLSVCQASKAIRRPTEDRMMRPSAAETK